MDEWDFVAFEEAFNEITEIFKLSFSFESIWPNNENTTATIDANDLELAAPIFMSKTQKECYDARISFPCDDCCCEYFDCCNNKIFIQE